jgi:hypothetical protein
MIAGRMKLGRADRNLRRRTMSPWGWLSITVFGFAPMAAAIYFTVADGKARRRVINATCRAEIVNGPEYSVYTLKHPVLRERSTGRLGVALERGQENEPTMIAGKVVLQPEWMRVQKQMVSPVVLNGGGSRNLRSLAPLPLITCRNERDRCEPNG